MTAIPMFHGFDGLLTLSRREGVDIRPTLLRVLTDLYVQTVNHTADEERQFSELASRLFDEVDDATRAAVRARLSIYPRTPRDIAWKLNLRANADDTLVYRTGAMPEPIAAPEAASAAPATYTAPNLSMKPNEASELVEMFVAATAAERTQIIHSLTDTPLKPSTKVDPRRAARALVNLEQAALTADAASFTTELADALILTPKIAAQIVSDAGGEALACALKALGMPGYSFQRVLLFLNPALGKSVTTVYRLARLYETISERSALVLLSAWRGTALASTRAKYRAILYDDERQRARPAAAQTRPAAQPAATTVTRNTSRG